jgi:hypothetical protein
MRFKNFIKQSAFPPTPAYNTKCKNNLSSHYYPLNYSNLRDGNMLNTSRGGMYGGAKKKTRNRRRRRGSRRRSRRSSRRRRSRRSSRRRRSRRGSRRSRRPLPPVVRRSRRSHRRRRSRRSSPKRKMKGGSPKRLVGNFFTSARSVVPDAVKDTLRGGYEYSRGAYNTYLGKKTMKTADVMDQPIA